MSEDFLFTVPSGEPVQLEPFNYAIVGQTQFSGKSTLLKRLSKWAEEQGFRSLIFDTKETEADYAGFGREVPVCLRETTDSFVLIGLLESMFKRRLTPYYATLSRITEGAKGFDDIIDRAKEREAKTRSSWLKDACRVLYDLLERLKAETSKVKTVPALTLHHGINRMVINEFSLEAQQLIVKNAFEDALRRYKRNLIMVLDEAFKFLPQGYSSPATRSVMQVITQGAKTGLYTWISTQFLAVTDKDPLKACAIKFLGTQDHITEVKHSLDLIPEVRGRFSSDDIMMLKLGHWILVRKRPPDVRVVYALPVGVPGHIGRKVAVEELTPEYVRDKFLVSRLKEDEEMYRKLYEAEKSKREDLEEEVRKLKAEPRISPEKFGALKAEKDRLESEVEILKGDLKTADALKFEKDEEIAELRKEVEAFRDFKAAFAKILPTPIPTEVPTPGFEPGAPAEIVVVKEQPALTVEILRKQLSLSQSNLEGRIAIVYAEGLLPTKKSFTVRQLNTIMEQRFGRKEAYANFPKVLTNFVAWGFFQKVKAGKRWDYRIKLDPRKAKEKGLLKVTEKIA